MVKLLLIYMLLLSNDTLATGYDEGQLFGLSKSVVVDKKLLQEVPQYKASTKDKYADLDENKLKQKAREASKNNEAIKAVQSSKPPLESHVKLSDADLSKNHADIRVCNQNNCTPKSTKPANDFAKAVSELKSLESAAKDFQHVELFFIKHYEIFNGEDKQCRQAWLGYNDCCKNHGWGQDAHLAGCNSEEKELGKLKEKTSCHYVGEYCAKKIHTPIGSKCQQYKETYCCFHSKLARIVMDAAHQQLALSWGDAKNPQCQGLKPEQLQKMDFDKIDLSEYFADLNQQTTDKNNKELESILKNKGEF